MVLAYGVLGDLDGDVNVELVVDPPELALTL